MKELIKEIDNFLLSIYNCSESTQDKEIDIIRNKIQDKLVNCSHFYAEACGVEVCIHCQFTKEENN